MNDVTIYTAMLCGYCSRAKRLLDEKGVAYEEIDVTLSPKLRNQMSLRSGGVRTVPQIFIGDYHIGGSDDLMELEHAGKLDELLTDNTKA